MINRHMKRFSASLIMSEMQIETTVWWYQSKWPPLKSKQITSAGESGQKREPSHTTGGNVNWCSHSGEHYGGSLLLLLLLRYCCNSFCDPMDCSPPGSSIHGTSQARILEWVAISLSRESSQPSNQICVSCIGRWIFHH